MDKQTLNLSKGITLMEVVVSVAIIAVLVVMAAGVYVSILSQITKSREKIAVSALADQYLEIVRNMPYSKIGTLNGNPQGDLSDLPNALNINFNGNTYQVYYAASYVDDPADGTALLGTDASPADYKQVKLYIKNVSTNVLTSFLTNVSPKGLEGMTSGGALSLKVFNAVGQPVPGATIHITNPNLTPAIDLTRTADSSGNWVEVGLPNSVNGYHITATKSGYSQDQTYPVTQQNPNPVKPDATIVNGQITQVSFSIDILSNLTFYTLNQTCQALSGVGLEVQGSKLIGTNPNLLKFDNNYSSNGSGQIALSNIEWDTYTPYLTGAGYMIYGTSPIQQVSLLPNTSQSFNMILGPQTANSLLVIVKDAATFNPIEGVNINLYNTSPAVNTDKITGGSVWSQNDWQGGPGQANFVNVSQYFSDDGNISTSGIPSGLRLAKIGGSYLSSGSLISSSFDTGTSSTSYTTITCQPTSQDPSTSLKFQIASNNDNLTWNFTGPDGTSGSYYAVPGTTISSSNNNNRYIRYKAFLSTTDASKTPVLTSVNLNYVSGCYTPGQVIFAGLSSGGGYQITASLAGYQTQVISNLQISGYNTLTVLLTH